MRIAHVHSTSADLKQTLNIGPHVLMADVGTESGGVDAGPNPHEYLTAALASCTSLTLRMYAIRKKWELTDAEVSVVITREAETTEFSLTIKLNGQLDSLQRERLLEIANRCPIHNLLVGKIEIKTVLMP